MTAEIFWRWFAGNESRFRRIDESSRDRLLAEIESQLHAFCPELYFEVGGSSTGPCELIITAEGDVSQFSKVMELVEAAPDLEGWRVVAFKPPMGFDFTTTHAGIRVDARELWFRPLESAKQPKALGLLIGVPGYEHSSHDEYLFAVKVALRTALGERTWAKGITHVDVGPLQGAPREKGCMQITELPRYIEWKRGRDR